MVFSLQEPMLRQWHRDREEFRELENSKGEDHDNNNKQIKEILIKEMRK
jgi:hypothetical protein